MFKGIYHGKRAHVPDLVSVLRRAQQLGIDHVMVTAGSLADIHEATLLIEQVSFEFPGMLGTTVGVHPTRVSEFESHPTGPTAHLQELIGLIRRHRELNIKAVGEFGLDYDRIQFSSPSLQRIYFEQQFVLAEESGLPLFLHMRDAAKDFIEIVKRNRHRFKHGVVHSFTGTAEEAKEILDLDLYIGINGWYRFR
jgi:TatD DNase family protein